MTRADYIAAQEKLDGTMYVTVGDYSYGTNGVLGNGERNDKPGQTEDRSVLNGYNSNGYLGEKNDGANGKNIIFVGGTITSGATGYTSIDNIGTSLLLAVPAYTNVTFKGTEFNKVISFDYQLYTSPWSQLGALNFEGCTFNGIIVGAIAAQTLSFTGCTFTNYTNSTSANNSNPTWIRPAYGNWTKGDNEGQGGDFRSLTEINFTGNTVTSTRPVKFERIAQWEMPTTVTATGNEFNIKAQNDDESTKNVGLYFGANAKFDLVAENNTKSGDTAALYTAVYSAPNNKTYAGLPAGSTVKDSKGNDTILTDAFEWKTTNNLKLETKYVAEVGGTGYTTLDAALAKLTADNHTLTLIDGSAWTYDNVYWKAGTESGSAATLKDAMEAAYAKNAGSITIICKPNATITKSPAHINVTGDITVYANGADFGGNDLSIGTNAAPKNSTTTINIYDAKNLVVWGQPVDDRADVWNVNFTDCVNDGWNFLMYRGRENGKATINATLTGCKATGFVDSIIHTTADGRITIKNCEFANNCAPVNIAHKQAGEMTVTVENSTFTNCGSTSTENKLNQYAAPVRIVNNNAAGTVATEVTNCTFADTVGNNGDILIGDGRDGKDSNDVTLTVKNTAANVQAQKPRYYKDESTVASKKAEKQLTAADSLNTTIADLLPVTEVDLDEFIKLVTSAGYNFDGASVAGTGKKLTVKWSPVSGCFDTRAGHECTVNNVAATGNTPKRVNNGLTQFQLYEGESYNVTVKNVSFVYEPAAFTVCENSGWAGSFTAEQAPAGQLYYMTTGDVTFESCDFDKVVLTTFNTTGTSTVKNCTLANVYNNYAIKDIRGEHIIVTGNTITNCGGGVMVSSTGTVSDVNISGNTFTNVDVAGTAPTDKVGTRALIQIASSGDYTGAKLILDGNTASNCGPILRQLNKGIADNDVLSKNLKGDLTGLGGELTFTGDSVKKTNGEEPVQPTIYTVKFSGSDVADKKVVSGTTITLPTAAKSGYTFKGWSDGSATYKVGDEAVITKDTTFTALWSYNGSSSGGGSSSSSRRYDVSAPSVKHGDVTVSPKNASKGDTVTVTVKPDSGYELDTLTVKDASGSKIKVKDKGDGKFTFTMPASKVTVSAEFAEIETLDFADVPTDAYYYEAVKWAAKKGITGGTGDGTFNPNGSCTRAHIVTFLWRAAGSPEPKSTVSFADVPAGSYYAKAVAWAVENGITLGTGDGTFSPNATCTRAQSVTFLYRALGTAPTTVNGFTDVTADAFYADAVAWAVESGVTNGTSASTFSPNNGCTRAQIVTFLFRAYQGK